MRRRAFRESKALAVLGTSAFMVLCAGTARADVALLRNGRSFSISEYRMQGNLILLVMEGGGQIALPNDQVVAIRREPAVVPSDPPTAQSGPALPQRPLLETPAPFTLTAPETLGEPDGPIAIQPAGVFDREALRDLAARIARKHRVDEALVLAVIEVESRYDAFAVSPRGAMGLMQLMPGTAARFAVRNAFNPVENVDGGVRYLKELLDRYSGQVRLALAAYNAGEDAVDQFRGIPPFRETQQYVVRVLKALPR
jgi:hypothetical protein